MKTFEWGRLARFLTWLRAVPCNDTASFHEASCAVVFDSLDEDNWVVDAVSMGAQEMAAVALVDGWS
jgi:hypothetical protein